MHRLSLPSRLPAALAGALLLTSLASMSEVGAQTLTTTRVTNVLSSPVWVGQAPGNDQILYVLEQSQADIEMIDRDTGAHLGQFMDLSTVVTATGGERGLLGLAFHPDFDTNFRFYVNYTSAGGSGITNVREYVAASYTAGPAANTGTILFSAQQPFSNHNGGNIAFGPNDGFLYVGMGDGGSANDPGNRAQTPASVFGSMLRLDVDNAPTYVAAGNPGISESSWDDRTWAYGLRNPWRFSFDPDNGDLWIADVGQNAWEEVNWVPGTSAGGENYGWRCMEGMHCTGLTGCTCNAPSLTDPVAEYSHSQGCSITGGVVYRGQQCESLLGTYFYADFCSGRIWRLRIDRNTGTVVDQAEISAQLTPNVGSIGSITSFGVDNRGEVYIVDGGGELFRIDVVECPCTTPVNYCMTAPNTFDPNGATMSFSGTTNISNNDFVLVANSVPPNTSGVFFYGQNEIRAPFGHGFRCIDTPVFRLPIQQADFIGQIIYSLDLNSLPFGGDIQAGDTWSFQCWYRNVAAGPPGYNLTDGLRTEWCP